MALTTKRSGVIFVFSRKVVVEFKGKKHVVDVPCSPKTPYEELVQMALKRLEKKEKERIQRLQAEEDLELERFFNRFRSMHSQELSS